MPSRNTPTLPMIEIVVDTRRFVRSRFYRLKFASIAASWCAICSRSQRAFKLRGDTRASLRRSFARRRMAGQ
jgi:hypothetical protein